VGGRNLRAGGGSDELMKSEALSRSARNLNKREVLYHHSLVSLLVGSRVLGWLGLCSTWLWLSRDAPRARQSHLRLLATAKSRPCRCSSRKHVPESCTMCYSRMRKLPVLARF